LRKLEAAMTGLGAYGVLAISDVNYGYNVNSSSFIETVYPADGTMIVYRNETTTVEEK